MLKTVEIDSRQIIDQEWVSFPGGELQGTPPKTLCPACRRRLHAATLQARQACKGSAGGRRLLCFQCYRADLQRDGALAAAGRLFTGSELRFQDQLPLEPVNRQRLEGLRSARRVARAVLFSGAGRFEERRRAAQIAARRQLGRIGDELRQGGAPPREVEQMMSEAALAAEHQFPASWLPFVVSR